jgi:hypothetical protein
MDPIDMQTAPSQSVDWFSDSATLRIDRQARAFPLGDELLLFSGACGSLSRANPMAALIWHGLTDGLEWQAMIDLLADAFNQPGKKVRHDLGQLAVQWRVNGLIAPDGPRTDSCGTNGKAPAPALTFPSPVPSPSPEPLESCYRLLDHRIRLCLPGVAAAAIIHPILAHLASPGAADCQVHLEVRRAADHYLLLCDGKPADWCLDEKGLAPMIHANLHLLAYQRSTHLTGLHAAAVTHGNNGVLLPANCGSGKSTLTAALVGSGFTYCSDDMVFLTHALVRMRPVPMAMGIKSGSWAVLAGYYPRLSSLACHERADGKSVRYLPPPPDSLFKDPKQTVALTHIVFPRYGRGKELALTPLTPAEGLCRIAQAGYDVPGGLTEGCVEQLVGWIAGIPCYEFHYGDLGEAVDCLKALLK